MERKRGSRDNNPEQDRLWQILEIAKKISSSLDLDYILEETIRVASGIVQAEAGSILLIDRSGGRLLFRTVFGEKAKELRDIRLQLGEGIAGYVAKTAECVIANDVTSHPYYKKDISVAIGYPTRSILCVPVRYEGNVIGVIEIINKKTGVFTDRDKELILAISELASGAINNARKHLLLKKNFNIVKAEIDKALVFIGGRSKKTRRVLDLVEKVSKTDSTVLISGQTGTGKELIARMIHNRSARRECPFVCVTCSVLPETLLESELFGYEKGAFTGATERKIGKFELAHTGTVFLDEVSTVPLNTQIKLLRVLQEKEIERVGGTRPVKVDIRVIAATNEDLRELINQGRFREDLYYRLKVIEIEVPPLKDRKEDIEELINHYVDYFAKTLGHRGIQVSDEVKKVLMDYHWPGNVRELRNVIERSIVLDTDGILGIDDLPGDIVNPVSRQVGGDKGSPFKITGSDGMPVPLEEMEREYIKYVLEHTGGNKSNAAKLLGISRNRLERKLRG